MVIPGHARELVHSALKFVSDTVVSGCRGMGQSDLVLLSMLEAWTLTDGADMSEHRLIISLRRGIAHTRRIRAKLI
jgi:hypothetical protein